MLQESYWRLKDVTRGSRKGNMLACFGIGKVFSRGILGTFCVHRMSYVTEIWMEAFYIWSCGNFSLQRHSPDESMEMGQQS